MAVLDMNIDKMNSQKQFFKELFRNEIVEMGNLKDNQHIRLFQTKGENVKVKYFNNIDDLVLYTSRNNYYTNTYFNLSTTNGEGGTKQDLIKSLALVFDFDKKDYHEGFNHKDIIDKFKKQNLWFHTLVDTGNGYHAYMLIEPTKDIDKVNEVIKYLGQRLGADPGAFKVTQPFRVPGTFNVKDKDKVKPVSIIKQYKENIKRYKIDNLYKRFCNSERDRQQLAGVTSKPMVNNEIPPCIDKILKEGSKEGGKHNDLIDIVIVLRNRGKTIDEIMAIAKEWAIQNNSKDNIDYQVPYIYEKWKHKTINCKQCKYKYQCYKGIESNFDYPKDFNILNMSETHMKRIKPVSREGYKEMKANDLLVYGILKNNEPGLFRKEIVKEITYTDRKTKITSIRLNKDTLTRALNSLEDNGYIEVVNLYGEKFYKLILVNSKEELMYQVSYAATYECAKSRITPEELRLYSYMRYLHHKQQRTDTKVLKGNLFQINQKELSKELGITQQNVSRMIKNLFNEKLLTEWYRKPSQENGFDYIVYRLNY